MAVAAVDGDRRRFSRSRSRNHAEWSHHVVVLVLEDVAVPNRITGVLAELHDDSGDAFSVSLHRVLVAALVLGRACDVAFEIVLQNRLRTLAIPKFRQRFTVRLAFELLATQHLEV